MRSWLYLLFTVLLALVAAATAIAQVLAEDNPVVANLAFPPNAEAKVELAARLTAIGVAQQMQDTRAPVTAEVLAKVKIPPEARALSRSAYGRDPLSVEALRILALDAVSRGRDDEGLALLEGGHKLSRRSTAISMLLIDRYGTDRRDAEGMAVLDELLRRRSGAHGNLIAGLAANLARTDLLPDYRRLLSTRPPWAEQFWRQLAQTPPGLANAAALRLAYARDAGKVDPEVDGLLISALAQSGRFDDAAAVAKLIGMGPGNGPELVSNGDFSRVPEMPVFDWMITSSGDYGAEVDPKEHRLVLSAIAGARGELARQLVRLPASPLGLRVTPSRDTAKQALRGLNVELRCGAEDRVLYAGSLARGQATIQPGNCRWAWLVLQIAIREDEEGIDAALDRVSLSARR